MACFFLTIPAALIGAASKTANFTAAGYPGPAVLDDSGAVIASAIRYMTPNTVSILGLAAITSAVLSSADSSMLSASTMITQNIYRTTLRPRATVLEIGLVLRLAIWIMGAVATVMALYVNSVSDFWALSSDAVYVLLFPQLVGVFYARKRTNSYGSFIGFSVGALFRVLCGEPLVNLPVILKLPMYDERLGQQFPFRTLSMVLSFVTLMATSHLAKRLFTKGVLPQKYDVCCCFMPAAAKDTADKDKKADNTSKGEKQSSGKKTSSAPPTNAPSMLEIEENTGEALPSAVSTASQKTAIAGSSKTTVAPQEQAADGSQQDDVGKTSKEEAAGTSKKAAGHNKKKKHNRKDKSKTDSVASSAKKETATSDKEGADSFG
ncbi:high-affinity choline transporter 1-like [Ixodes scapularis]|uniref:high-affinity choline transporter 1-like n=1 Tax=Ixodes scapularis TaxID=6945 RepID=UPI001C39564D|nr:high-affinity choline transporter 1-like [Ixodes scapularis]